MPRHAELAMIALASSPIFAANNHSGTAPVNDMNTICANSDTARIMAHARIVSETGRVCASVGLRIALMKLPERLQCRRKQKAG